MMNNTYKFGNLTDVGLVRKANEDYYGCFETINGQIFVICDGMGGHVGGAIASHTAVAAIMEYYNIAAYDNIIVAMQNALIEANNAILKKINENPELEGMGTTCVLLIVKNNAVYFAHIGDSRIYYLHKKKLHQITEDHSFVQTLLAAGYITEAEAEQHPKKNQITKALGIANTIEPTICNAAILPMQGDIFLLCSDGLTGMVGDDDLLKILENKTTDLQKKCAELIGLANKNGGVDNITAQLLQFGKTTNVQNNFTASISFENNKISNQKIKSKKVKWVALVSMLVLIIGVYFGYYYYYKNSNAPFTPNKIEKIKEITKNDTLNSIQTTTTSNNLNTQNYPDTEDEMDNVNQQNKYDNETPQKNKEILNLIPIPSTKPFIKPETLFNNNLQEGNYKYTIKKGDSTSVMKKLFNKTWAELKKFDKEYKDSLPEVGKKIMIQAKYYQDFEDDNQKAELIRDLKKNKEKNFVILPDEKVIIVY